MTEVSVETEVPNVDVMQVDVKMMTVPVTVEGQVQTRELPGLAGGWGAFPLTANDPARRLLAADPRRKSAVIWSDTANVYMSDSQAGARTGNFAWLANVPMSITSCDEVWFFCTTDTTVHVYSEVWAP